MRSKQKVTDRAVLKQVDGAGGEVSDQEMTMQTMGAVDGWNVSVAM